MNYFTRVDPHPVATGQSHHTTTVFVLSYSSLTQFPLFTSTIRLFRLPLSFLSFSCHCNFPVFPQNQRQKSLSCFLGLPLPHSLNRHVLEFFRPFLLCPHQYQSEYFVTRKDGIVFFFFFLMITNFHLSPRQVWTTVDKRHFVFRRRFMFNPGLIFQLLSSVNNLLYIFPQLYPCSYSCRLLLLFDLPQYVKNKKTVTNHRFVVLTPFGFRST